MTQLAVNHEELLVPDASSQEVKDSKVHYTLTEVKVSSFGMDYFGLCSCMDQVSSFLEEVGIYECPAKLVCRVAKL